MVTKSLIWVRIYLQPDVLYDHMTDNKTGGNGQCMFLSTACQLSLPDFTPGDNGENAQTLRLETTTFMRQRRGVWEGPHGAVNIQDVLKEGQTLARYINEMSSAGT